MDSKQLFRLCHICDTLNEGETEILRCQRCGKGFLPINYFDKIRAKAQKASELGQELPDFLFNPLNGLIVFW